MRMLKIALVLLVLASFAAIMTTVSTAVTATPTVMPMAGTMATPMMGAVPNATMGAMPNATMGQQALPNATMGMPAMQNATMSAPGMPNATAGMPATSNATVIAPGIPMKTGLGTVYDKLVNGITMPGGRMSDAGASVKTKASKLMSDTYGRIAIGAGKPVQSGLSAPQAISQLSGLPKIGSTRATAGKAPGGDLMIILGL